MSDRFDRGESRRTVARRETRTAGERSAKLAHQLMKLHETSLEVKVAQVLRQVHRGEAHITFDPATASVNLVVAPARDGSRRP